MESRKYYTAETYTNWERVGDPFEKNNRLYQTVKTKCDRCGGLGIIVSRVENGRPIPIPVDGGICYNCEGRKYITKDVRLYTKQEFDAMEKAKAKAAEKKKAEQEKKMKAEFDQNRKDWLRENGFTSDGFTYIVVGESYSIRELLKSAGFHFNGGLKRWMSADPAGYENRVIKFSLDELFEMSAWGKGSLLSTAKDLVDSREKEMFPPEPSEWFGEVGERVPASTITLVSMHSYQNQWGYGRVYTFKTENNAILTWFTKVDLKKGDGETFTAAFTIKKHDTYKDQKTTIITRLKVK